MPSTTIAWEFYRSFLSVLTEGSLSGAARSLGITQPTVGRHIAQLERELGVVLFTRSPSGLLPTETAESLRTHALGMQNIAAALERAAHGQGGQELVQGTVRISCSDVVGVEVLPPMLVALRRRHPGLKVELVLTDRVQDLLSREADIAVRMVQPRQEQLIARRVGQIEIGLHARRDYLERHGVPRNADQLAAHSAIGYDQLTAALRAAEKSFKWMRRSMFSLRSDSNLAQLSLIRAGAGIGMCQVPLAKRDRDLVRVLPRLVSLPLETWVTMHEDLRGNRGCRVTFDALVDGLVSYIEN